MRIFALLTLLACVLAPLSAWGGDPTPEGCACATEHKRCAPAGGWSPYGGGLLKWLPCCCYPTCGGPDDYCRKPLPCLCWPAYPSYFKMGPPACDCPSCGSAVE